MCSRRGATAPRNLDRRRSRAEGRVATWKWPPGPYRKRSAQAFADRVDNGVVVAFADPLSGTDITDRGRVLEQAARSLAPILRLPEAPRWAHSDVQPEHAGCMRNSRGPFCMQPHRCSCTGACNHAGAVACEFESARPGVQPQSGGCMQDLRAHPKLRSIAHLLARPRRNSSPTSSFQRTRREGAVLTAPPRCARQTRALRAVQLTP